MGSWKLSAEQAHELWFVLDEIYDLDHLYIIYGIPHNAVNEIVEDNLDQAIIPIGCRKSLAKSLDWEKSITKIMKKYYTPIFWE